MWRNAMTDGKKLDQGLLWEEYYTNLHRAYQSMRIAFASSGLTQDELAEKLGIDKSLISKRLNGSENLTLKTLSFMATALNCRLKIEPIPYHDVMQSVARLRTTTTIPQKLEPILKRSVLDGYSHASTLTSRKLVAEAEATSIAAGSQSISTMRLASIPRSAVEGSVQNKPKRSVSEPRRAA
jgi:transcriptional regulator with XRE-family HTH domain